MNSIPFAEVTVVQKLNQGAPRDRAVIDRGGAFCFFLHKQKEKDFVNEMLKSVNDIPLRTK